MPEECASACIDVTCRAHPTSFFPDESSSFSYMDAFGTDMQDVAYALPPAPERSFGRTSLMRTSLATLVRSKRSARQAGRWRRSGSAKYVCRQFCLVAWTQYSMRRSGIAMTASGSGRSSLAVHRITW